MGSKKLTKTLVVFIAFLLVFSMNVNAFAAIQTTHTVKSGDTLYGISTQYNVPVETLKKLNNLTDSVIKIGQELKLTDDVIYVVQTGDTLFGISQKYNVSMDAIKKENNLTTTTVRVGQELTIPLAEVDNNTETTTVQTRYVYASEDGAKAYKTMSKTNGYYKAYQTAHKLKIYDNGNDEWYYGYVLDANNKFVKVYFSAYELQENETITTKYVYAGDNGTKAYKTMNKANGYYKAYESGHKLKIYDSGNENWYYGYVLDSKGKFIKTYFNISEVISDVPTTTRYVYATNGGAKSYKTTSKTNGYYRTYQSGHKLKIYDYGNNDWYYGYVLDANNKFVKVYFSSGEVQNTVPQTETVKVTTATVSVSGTLNVRSGAGTNYAIVGSLSNGTKVEIIKESGNWANVKYEGSKTGWVSQDYLINKTTTTIEVDKPTPTVPTVQKATVNVTGGLNVRQGPSTTFGIVGLLSDGTVIDVIKEEGNWANIEYGNLKGWVSKDYIVYGVQTTNPTVPSGALKGKIVVLDPGHGGNDSGAVGIDGSTYEKTLALNYSLDIKSELEAYGATVYMTRTSDTRCGGVYATDTNTDLRCRVVFADNKNADIFISVHFNSAYGATGTETYYNETDNYDGNVNPYPSESKLLAESVHKNYRPAVNLPDRGVRNANYYVNRMANVPSILLEVGFMSSSTDLNRVKNSSVQDAVAKGVAKGVNEYFSKIDN